MMSDTGHGVWEYLTIKDGLPGMKIESIYEDSNSVMWFGTQSRGVVSYDGYEFKYFNRKNGLKGGGVFSIIEDGEGKIWLATNQGVSYIKSNKITNIENTQDYSFLWGNCKDRDGNVWLGLERRPSKPAAICRCRNGSVDIIDLEDEVVDKGRSIHQIVCDEDGRIWIGGDGLYVSATDKVSFQKITDCEDIGKINRILVQGPLKIFIGEKGFATYQNRIISTDIFSKDNPPIIGLVCRDEETYWAISHNGRLMVFDGFSFRLIYSFNISLNRALWYDSREKLWIGTNGLGVISYEEKRFKIISKSHGLLDNSVNCIVKSKNDELLIGTKLGLSILKEGRIVEQNTWVDAFRAEFTQIVCIEEDLIMGLRNGYVLKFNGKNFEQIAFKEGGTRVDNIKVYNDKILFSFGFGKGFGLFDGDCTKYYDAKSCDSCPDWIGAIDFDRDGKIWMGSSAPAIWEGLCVFDGKSFKYIKGLEGLIVTVLLTDSDNLVWVGTNEGLFCFDHKEFNVIDCFESISDKIITSLCKIGEVMWIGTEGSGVYVYDGRVLQLIQFEEFPYLNIIHQIYSDEDNTMWFSTAGGVVRYSPQIDMSTVKVTLNFGV